MENDSLRERYLATLTPKEMIYELLAAAVSDIRQAAVYMERGPMEYETSHRFLLHAQAIFLELRSTLPPGDDACALFEALAAALADANIAGSSAPLYEAEQVAERLRIQYGAALGVIGGKR